MNKLYQSFGSNQRQGFTLMEIMVVIIVIAVLASVAGPMIGSITDQGKKSATKAQMQNLKTAFVNFANDMGRYPHNGATLSSTSFNGCWGESSVHRSGSACPFTTPDIASSGATVWSNMGMVSSTYNKRWKGPYIDGNPETFFVDSWGGTANVFYQTKGLWVRSAGPDGVYEATTTVVGATYGDSEDEDDVTVSIAKVKFN